MIGFIMGYIMGYCVGSFFAILALSLCRTASDPVCPVCARHQHEIMGEEERHA